MAGGGVVLIGLQPVSYTHLSAVAAAAYRSGTKLTNEWDGMTHDYTRKGGIVPVSYTHLDVYKRQP